jgi:hydroxymethylpyrimidine/phosphomethylpyrimidine kinase
MNRLAPSLPVALSIAGSDPSGGAGIQMDLKVFQVMGVFGAAAITALTIQNSCGVRDVFPVPPGVVREQVVAILEDMDIRALKCGMLWSADTVRELARLFEGRKGTAVIIDPVIASSSGRRLLDDAGVDLLASRLLCQAMLITPNIPEACILAGMPIKEKGDMVEAAIRIWEMSGKRCAVLVKGGHGGTGQAVDLLFDGKDVEEFRTDRLKAGEVHGTGCALSAAITAGVAKGLGLSQAVQTAKELVTSAMKRALRIGQGASFLNFTGAGSAG